MGKIKRWSRALFVYLSTIALAFVSDLYVAAVVGLPVWFVWNKTMVQAFHLPTITYCNAVGMCLISFLLLTRTFLKDRC